MDSNQDSVSLKIQLDISQLPKAEKETKASIERVYEEQIRSYKATIEAFRRLLAERDALLARSTDKQSKSEQKSGDDRRREEQNYSDWWNRELGKRERSEETTRQRSKRDVDRINAETRRQAEENARFHEQMAGRITAAQQKIQTQQAKWNATNVINSLGGTGGAGGGGGINQVLAGMFGGGGGGNAPPGGSGGSGFLGGFLGGLAGAVVGSLIDQILDGIRNAVQSAIGFITGLLQQGARAWLDYAAHMQQVRIGFDTLLGSASAAHKMLHDLEQLAVKSPFQFEDLAEGARRLIAMGTAAQNVRELMTSIGNSVAAIGGRAAEFQRVVYAIGDIQAKGKLTGEEVRQLANNAVPVMKILGEATGKTNAELRKMIEESKISSEFFVDAFQRYSEIHFGDAMEKQARTFLGALSNIEDGLKQKAERMFAPLFDQMSELLARFGDIFTGDDGLLGTVERAEDEFIRAGVSLGMGLSEGLSSPQVQGAMTAAVMRLVPTPEKIQRAIAEAAINRAVNGSYYVPDVTPGDVPLGNPTPKPWKPQPFGSQVDPLEQQRRQETINFFSQLTGGDGEKAMERYRDALTALNDQIANFNAKTNEQHARLQLLKMGFTDLNSETARAVINAAKQLDLMEEQRKAAEKQKRLRERFDDAVLDAVRGANQKTIDLAMRDASALEEFNVNLALKLKDMGEEAGHSAEAVEFALERIRAALRVQDDAKNVKTAEDEFIRVGKAIDAVHFKLRGSSEADEAWLNFLVNSGLQAEYAAGKNEALVTTLDLLKQRHKSLAEAQEEWKRKQQYDSTIKQVSGDLDQMTESLRKQMAEFARLEEATPLESFVEGLKHLKDFRLNDADADVIKSWAEGMGAIADSDAYLTSWVRLQDIINKMFLNNGLNPNDAVLLASQVTEGVKAALRASAMINPLTTRRNELDREYVKLQREVGLESAVAAETYRNAWQRAINDVQLRDMKATESRIRSQVEIADKTVFHSEQVRARFEEHVASMKGYTDIVADAFVGASDKIGQAFSKLFGLATKHLGAFGDIVNDIATNLFKMVSNRLLMKLVDAMLGGGGAASGGGGFSFGSVGGQALGGAFGGGGGVAGFNPGAGGFFGLGAGSAAQMARSFFGGGSSITTADTFSGTAGSMTAEQFLRRQASLAALDGTGRQGSGSMLGGFGRQMAMFAPLMGLSLGMGLGGGSRAGGILGGVGGLMGGALVSGLVSGGGLSGMLGGQVGNLMGWLGVGSGALGVATLGVGTVVGLLGAHFLSRSRQRREEETVRSKAILDAKGQIDELIRQVRNHRTDPMSALAQAADIRSKYMADMQQLKDKKTRNHALLTVREIDYKIGQLRAAASHSLNDNARANITAAFATGGVVPGLPGEPRLVMAHGGEIIASLAHQSQDFVAAAREAGIPGVRGGGEGVGGRFMKSCVCDSER